MTNLRDALEKAGVTASGIPADSSSPTGEAADPALDKIVDDLAKRLTTPDETSTPSNDFDHDRPKLVPDTSALAGVVDRIEQLVTGEPGGESQENEQTAVSSIPETPDVGEIESSSEAMSVEAASGETLLGETAAEEPTHEQAILTDTASGDSIPLSTEQQSLVLGEIPARETPPAVRPEASTDEANEESVTTEMQSAAAFTNGPPPIDMSSIPMLQTDKISGNTTLIGKFSKELFKIEDDDAHADTETSFDGIAAGVEVSQYDPLGIEGDISIDPNQAATFGEYDEYEVVAVPTDGEDEAADVHAASLDSETQDEADTKSKGFDPNLIHGISPGTTMSVETTEELEIDDPVATASELTDGYVPQDLEAPAQFELASPTGLPTDVSASAKADEATDAQEGFSFPKSMTDLVSKADSGDIPLPAEPTSATEEDTGNTSSFLETTNLQPAAIPTTPPPTTPDAPTYAPQAQTAAPTESVSFREFETPTDVAVDKLDDEPTAFERHLLENLTVEPNATEYQQLATAAINSDLDAPPSSICFVSAEAGSHHTDVVAHVGVICAATMNKRVLVVDASDCPDSLTRVFRRDKQPGLKNMTAMGDDWSDMVLPTAIPNLFLLPHGWRRGGSTRWNAGEFSGLISLFSRAFDVTLVDAGVAERSEDAPFYAACDRTLLIARLGQTDRHMAAAVKDGLTNSHVRLDGCVVTNHSA